MALCLAASLVSKQCFDPVDQMNRYCDWARIGYMSSNGRCFDIGVTVSRALDRYLKDGNPFAGDVDPDTAGNGALMRLAPVVMFYSGSDQAVLTYAGESTRTTHAAQECIECSKLFGLQVKNALAASSKREILSAKPAENLSAKVQSIAAGDYIGKTREEIRGSGYCVASLEAALWCFEKTNSFEQAVLTAANLGEDADTTAAICGQIAGAHYGVKAIPRSWLDRLAMREEIEQLALSLANSPHSLMPLKCSPI
jgi:ADP-ribosyl-[dinitrogen reductase] hydrolase